MSSDSDLLADLADLCAEVSQIAAEPVAARVRELVEGLSEPLTIVVVGDVDAGKSTLINALINKRIAATGRSETTQFVTRFRFGETELAFARLIDGTVRELAFDPRDGLNPTIETVQDNEPVDIQQVSYVDITLSIDELKRMTVIDSPGLDSIHEENSLRTTNFLTTRDADAVLFTFDHAVTTTDRDVLHRFRVTSTGGLGTMPSNALGVLSRIDLLASGGRDPWVEGRNLALSNARRLGGDISMVIPVMGLLAETANAGVFREEDAANLRKLSQLPEADRELMLLSERYFDEAESEVKPSDRTRLKGLLGLYGLTLLIEAAGRGASATAMTELLKRHSAIAELEREIACRLTNRRQVLKAARTLTELERIAAGFNAVDRGHILDRVEELFDYSVMHGLAELRVLSYLSKGESSLSDQQISEAMRILFATDPRIQLGVGGEVPCESLFEIAAEAVRRWMKIANTQMDPRSSEVARVVARTLEILLERLETLEQ